MRVRIRGVEKVKKNADKIQEKIIKATRMGMIKSAIIDIETGAKKKITEDGHIDTGRLRASIHTTYKDADTFYPKGMFKPASGQKFYRALKGKGFRGKLDVKRKLYNIFVGTDVHYSTKIEELDSYLYFAFKQAQKKLERRIQKEVKEVLRKRRNLT